MGVGMILRQWKWTTGVLTACTLICGCSPGGPITVTSAYGRGIKFSGLGSRYCWSPDEGKHKFVSPGFNELVHESAERNLAAKGFKLDPGSPEFWIDYRVGVREKTDASRVPSGLTVEEGSLVLEVIDPATREFIWCGVARAQIRDSDTPEVRKQRLESAMRQLMSKFPAKA